MVSGEDTENYEGAQIYLRLEICPNEIRNVAVATADDSPLKSRRDDIPITGGFNRRRKNMNK